MLGTDSIQRRNSVGYENTSHAMDMVLHTWKQRMYICIAIILVMCLECRYYVDLELFYREERSPDLRVLLLLILVWFGSHKYQVIDINVFFFIYL